MKQLLPISFIVTFVFCGSLNGMENNIVSRANVPQIPQEMIIHIAGYCLPKTKNILMRVCKDFCTCIKNKTVILKANPFTVSLKDKIRAMFMYTYANNLEMMELLLNHGVDANCENLLDMTPFHVASSNGNEKAMQLLINHGADVDIPNPEPHQLLEAIYKGDDEKVIQEFLKTKDDPNCPVDSELLGATLLFLALYESQCNIATLLIYAGAKIDNLKKATDDGIEIDYGIEIDNIEFKTTLQYAAHQGYISIVELLLTREDTQINQANSNGWTPLYMAARQGHTEIVQLLLDAGAEVNLETNTKYTPLRIASEKDHTEVIQALLNAQANIHQKDEFDGSALHNACYNGNVPAVTLLLNAGAQVNCVNNQGWTPLCAAAHNGNVTIVALLLEHGANIQQALTDDSTTEASIKKGDTALQIAQKRGHTDVVELLQEHAQKNQKNKCVIQ